MDYRTLFLAYLASLIVYTAFAVSLAWRNREVRGFSWIAASLALTLLKVFLQGSEGRVPTLLSSLIANDLYVLAFLFQLLGLRWFVHRQPLAHRWPIILVVCLIVVYSTLYIFYVPYISNVINIPSIAILGFTAFILLRHGKGLFVHVSQWTAGFVIAEMLVYGYRAIITNLSYSQPWMTNTAQQDPRWNYSLMAMMFLSTCVLMCDLWFFVVELQRELITRARTDSLTGALNRRALYEEAEREISRTVRAGHDFSVLLIDIDDFKLMNDTRGHAAGDFALQRLVNTVRSMLRTEDWLARTGGEEFAILLPETDVEQALVVAERIRSSIEHMNLVFENVRLSISASIGVAQMSTSVPTVDDVLHRADIAMYSAKRGGKNRTVVYRDGMTSNPDLDPTSLSDLINSTAH